MDSAVRGLITATKMSFIYELVSYSKRRAADRYALRGSGRGIHSSTTRRLSRTLLEHHHRIHRARPVADPSPTCRHNSQCISCEPPGRIGRVDSVRLPLHVARRRHWSTTTPSQRLVQLQARPKHRHGTPRASGVSVRDRSVAAAAAKAQSAQGRAAKKVGARMQP